MIKYKLHHKPTGLYYCDIQGRFYEEQTNLNSIGKLFAKLPHSSWLGWGGVEWGGVKTIFYKGSKITTTQSDWEVVTLELVERGRKPL